MDINTYINDVMTAALTNGQTIAFALMAVSLGYILGQIFQHFTIRTLHRSNMQDSAKHVIGTLVKAATILIGIITALGLLGLDKTVTSMLAGAGVIGLALGFAFQDIAANFISGLMLMLRKPFTEGEIVDIDGHLGRVMEIDLRTTILRTLTGETVHIPNKNVFSAALINHSESGRRRVDIDCGVSYGDNLSEAEAIAKQALGDLEFVEGADDVEMFFNELGDSAITFTVRFWIDFDSQIDFLNARHQAILALKKAYDENGITMPFPTTTLDFDAKGGKTLKDMLDK